MTQTTDELIRMTATEAVGHLRSGELSPLDLIDAAEQRIAAVEPQLNALPTTCFDRARDHAKRLMAERGKSGSMQPGWLGGLPLAIKDVTDVAGVRTTYGSPVFKDHVPETSNPVVERIERQGGIVVAKSNTPEFAAGGSTFNEVFGRTRNPWNLALTPAGSTGGGAAALAAGEIWLAHGSDHAGSLRRPATYCSVVGLRPSAGRVTRGTTNHLYAPLSVQGPMARTVADVALFLDAMTGLCPRDPLTFDAPAVPFVEVVRHPVAPKRIAFTTDFAGTVPVDRETRDMCIAAARRFEDIGAIVEEVCPPLGDIEAAFLPLRSQHYVVERERLLAEHRDQIKPDIIWNTELGLKQTPSDIAAAERERAKLFANTATFFETYDLLVTPGASTPAFDVMRRMPETIDGRKLEHYLGASLITAIPTLMGMPSIAVPAGFDQYDRPLGIQIVGRHRGEAALLSAAHLFEQITGLSTQVPIDPRPAKSIPGVVTV
ncbi:MAG: amidase [Hyphomicrobiaceae bacterium]